MTRIGAIRDLNKSDDSSDNEFCSISYLMDNTKKVIHALSTYFIKFLKVNSVSKPSSFLLQAVTENGGNMFDMKLMKAFIQFT